MMNEDIDTYICYLKRWSKYNTSLLHIEDQKKKIKSVAKLRKLRTLKHLIEGKKEDEYCQTINYVDNFYHSLEI